MATKQYTRPYTHGYDLGVGVDRISGSPMGQVVRNAATPVATLRLRLCNGV